MSYGHGLRKDRRVADKPWKRPVHFLYHTMGGATLTFAWLLVGLGTGLASLLLGVGLYLAASEKLTSDFIALAGVIQGLWIGMAGIIQTLVTARAIGEDAFVVKTKLVNGKH